MRVLKLPIQVPRWVVVPSNVVIPLAMPNEVYDLHRGFSLSERECCENTGQEPLFDMCTFVCRTGSIWILGQAA